MLSVNTNTDAMTALEYLNQTQGQLAQTENAVSTGLTVATAKDNGADLRHRAEHARRRGGLSRR